MIRDAATLATTWLLTGPDGTIETFDSAGRLVRIDLLGGRWQNLIYSDLETALAIAPKPGLLIEVHDNFMRKIQFRYDAQGHMTTLTDPGGQEYFYSYALVGTQKLLASVTFPDGLRRQYLYKEEFYQPNRTGTPLLTGIVDEISPEIFRRYATFKYDNAGVPVRTEHNGGTNLYTFNPSINAVTDPLGAVRNYSFGFTNNLPTLNAQSQPGPGGAGTVWRYYSYDSNGNITNFRDFNNTATDFSYDGRNLEVSRTEAVRTPLARKISTNWHPERRLKTGIAEPKRITTFTYDDVGNMIERVEQATSDATGFAGFNATPVGSSRRWTNTYNGAGQLLSVTGPRVGQVVSYSYDAQGNLASMRNPLGHLTTYSDYDANGRVGSITTPDGVISVFRYTPRGWLANQTMTSNGVSESTSYDYDGTGQLTKVRLPNGTDITYGYDDARRLTRIGDSAGNTIRYILNPLGQRTSEEILDDRGILSRRINRIFDALSRLTQVTGATQ